MIVALIFAYAWGVLQLVFLGSISRTIRWRTAFGAISVGLYACAPAAVLLMMAWTRPVAWMTGSLRDVVRIGSYTLDPFIEEFLKVTPLAILLRLPAIRRQWSLTDCVVMAAATGSGFGLAESLYRFAATPHLAQSVSGGWAIRHGFFADVFVPGMWTSITSWLPVGAVGRSRVLGVVSDLNIHLAWSAIGGLAVGLMFLDGGKRARVAAAVLMVYIGADHAALNADVSHVSRLGLLTGGLRALRNLLGWGPIAALAWACWLDRSRQKADESDLKLALERSEDVQLVGTIRAALSRLPWSVIWVDNFARCRRLYRNAQAGDPAGAPHFRAAATHLRDRTERLLAGPPPPLMPSTWNAKNIRRTVMQRSVIMWLLLTLPATLWFVVGGFPQTAAVQRALTQQPGWAFMVVLSIAAQVWVGWKVCRRALAWSTILRFPVGDDAAMWTLRLLSGAGAAGLGGLALVRATTISATSPLISNAHALDAFADSSPAGSMAVLGSSSFQFPPGETPTPPINSPVTGEPPISWPRMPGERPFTWRTPPFEPRPLPGNVPEPPPLIGPGLVAGRALAATGVAGAAFAAGVVAPYALAKTIEHAAELAGGPDPDEISPPGGTPAVTPVEDHRDDRDYWEKKYGDDPRNELPKKERISDANKEELEDSEWLKQQLPNDEDRREFMEWLRKGHTLGEIHEHVRPGSPAAAEKVEQWRKER